MNNKKSLLQDSLQELENIKNESLELAKEQLINESADLLEKKSAALFEKLIAGEDGEEESTEEESNDDVNEVLQELKDMSDDEEMDSDDEEMDSDDEEMDSDDEEEMDSDDEEEISLDALRKAAEEHGFKLVADSDEEEMDSDEEEMDSDDEEEMDSDEEEMDSDEEDIEFNDVEVDDKVLAEPSDEEEEEDEEESFQKINENFKRNNNKMRNTKKQVLKDLRDVSFNKLVEAYYNMDEEDSFVVKEGEPEDEYDNYAPDPDSDYERRFEIDSDMDETEPDEEEMYDEGYGMEEEMSMPSRMSSKMGSMPSRMGSKMGSRYSEEEMDEDMMYEIDMPEGGYGMESMSDESYMDEMTDDDINEMLSEMDIEEDMFDESIATRTRDKFVKQGLTGPIHGKAGIDEKSELEGMFEEMSMEELEEMNSMLEGDGSAEHGARLVKQMDDYENQEVKSGMKRPSNEPKMLPPSYMSDKDETDLTEAEIEEMLYSMKEEEEIEESSAIPSQTKMNRGNRGGGSVQGRPERRSGVLAEEDDEDVESLKEQLKKLKQENKSLNEGFTNKVKSLENKVYDVTISALKAGFVNKFLLEHPLRENEKLQIIHRFTNAQTKEQIKETYISLTNEFAKGQTVKDGSMLNESVQNKVGRVHRTDNAIVTEKNLMNESDESNRFKQLLNYNFNKKK